MAHRRQRQRGFNQAGMLAQWLSARLHLPLQQAAIHRRRHITQFDMPDITAPGPLGMAETSPNASAPQRTASAASATVLMQQILMH